MRGKVRPLIANLLLVVLLAIMVAYFCQRFAFLKQGTDFVHLYAAARMVGEGHGRQLYDLDLQEQYQARYAGRIGTYFIHPPFETLLYLPFALFSLSRAYLLWSIFNVLLLIAVSRALQRHLLPAWDWRLLVMLCLVYPPVLVNFLLGQDSVVLLLFVVFAFAALQERKEFAAGCLLACGLFKFQLALPLALVLLPGRSRKFWGGFGTVASAFAAISVGICGPRVLWLYPRLLTQVNHLPLAAVHPREQMADLRGLLSLFSFSESLQLELTIIASLICLAIALLASKRAAREPAKLGLGFSQAVIAACLVAYHLLPHDLSLLLLPLAVWAAELRAANRLPLLARIMLAGVGLLLFLPPLHLLLLIWHSYAVMGWLVLAVYAATVVGLMGPAEGQPATDNLSR